jgi:tetratricopeptide (TPR) repeat protein
MNVTATLFILLLMQSPPPAAAVAEEKFAVRMLADAAFRGDWTGLAMVRERFRSDTGSASAPLAARAWYFIALSEWLEAQARGGDSRAAISIGEQARINVEKAIALDPSRVEAHVLRNRILYLLFSQGALPRDTAFPLIRESWEAARKLRPDDPLVILLDGAFRYYGSPDHEGGRKLVRQSIDALASRSAEDPHAAIWLAIEWVWYGMMFLGDGQMEEAADSFQAALEVQPDYEMVRSAFLPMTALVEPPSVPSFQAGRWPLLLSDAKGDGRYPGQSDLLEVRWKPDQSGERIWFRFHLASAPDPARLGVNLALDLDGNDQTGNNWWAGNTGFKYDRLVTVWIAQGRDGRYRGRVGTADASDILAGKFTTSPSGAVTWAIDEPSRDILVGVERKAFGSGPRLRVVATVGSNTDWNDTAPDKGFATLQLQRD